MKFYDFEYDGLNLSDFGYMICQFGSNGVETVSNGSQITFNTVSAYRGSKWELISTEYGECIEATFQICKNPCMSPNQNMEISVNELIDLTGWLSRKEFHKFKLIHDDYLDIYFEASFNINRIEIGGHIYGLELTMKTNRPFGLREPVLITLTNENANGEKFFYDISNEEGYIYPHMEILMTSPGTLTIANSLESDRVMTIKNCVAGEKITLDYPKIQSTVSSHKIYDDFNWTFFRVASTFTNKKNVMTISLPCIISLKYSPVVRIGL